MGNRVVSQAISKVDYKALVTGKAVYTDDLAAKDSLVVKVLRSPYAHALIEDINLTRAELVPDIECILTYKDCPDKRGCHNSPVKIHSITAPPAAYDIQSPHVSGYISAEMDFLQSSF